MNDTEQALFRPFVGKPGSCDIDEYALLLNELKERDACNFLVFGAGRDSNAWTTLNRGGRTVFLEYQQKWIQHARRHVPGIEVYKVGYPPQRKWRTLVHRAVSQAVPELDVKGIPPAIRSLAWEVIFVDSPVGIQHKGPGRHSSIYTADQLVDSNGVIFVHDCDRPLERTCCDLLYRRHRLVEEIGGMRKYKATKG